MSVLFRPLTRANGRTPFGELPNGGKAFAQGFLAVLYAAAHRSSHKVAERAGAHSALNGGVTASGYIG